MTFSDSYFSLSKKERILRIYYRQLLSVHYLYLSLTIAYYYDYCPPVICDKYDSSMYMVVIGIVSLPGAWWEDSNQNRGGENGRLPVASAQVVCCT